MTTLGRALTVLEPPISEAYRRGTGMDAGREDGLTTGVMRFAVCLVFFVLASCGRTVVYEPRQQSSTMDAGTDAGVKPCVTGTVPLSHTTPAIFFVLDRSGSMAFDLQGHTGAPGDPLQGPARWQIMADTMSQV